jgi:hypothetical protein
MNTNNTSPALRIVRFLSVGALALALTTTAFAQGSAFTWQGHLTDAGSPANGLYDLTFVLYDAASNGTALGTNTLTAAVVSNGLYTAVLDFGAAAFNGDPRWLELSVRTNGAAAFTALLPRQAVTTTPYAIRAANAGTVAAANVTGTIPLSVLPSAVITNGASTVSLSGVFTGSGAGLTNLNSMSLTGPLSVSWNLGNVGHIDNGGTGRGVAVSGNYA